MKLLHAISRLLLACAICDRASAQSPPVVQRVVLNPQSVIRIPVAMDRLTTVRLPSPPTDIESAKVGTEPHPDAFFLLATQPGSPTFSLRALLPRTNTTMNVSWRGQTYVFELFESSQPWLSVVCEAPAAGASRTGHSQAAGISPARLLGMLDIAKAYGLLHQQQPQAVAGVEVVRPNSRRNYGPYSITTEEVFRFDAEDTLVFRVAISNQTAATLEFIPESVMVRAGTNLFHQSIAEMRANVPAFTGVPAYFAITGSPDGSRNGLSPKNEFMVLIQRLGLEEQPPVAATPPPVSSPDPALTRQLLAKLLCDQTAATNLQHIQVSEAPPAPAKTNQAPRMLTQWNQPAPAAAAAPVPASAMPYPKVVPSPPAAVQHVATPYQAAWTAPAQPRSAWTTPVYAPNRYRGQPLRGRVVDCGSGGGGFGLSIRIGLNPFQ